MTDDRPEWLNRPLPPPPLHRRYFVRGPLGVAGFHAILLEDAVYGALIHYDRNTRNSWPCTGDECSCRLTGMGSLYKSYLSAALLDGQLFVLELTDKASRALEVIRQDVPRLRGVELHVFRRGDKHNSPVGLRYVQTVPEEKLPAPLDTVAVLRSLWGLQADGSRKCPKTAPAPERRRRK